jgi:alkane 1-monooxygenase
MKMKNSAVKNAGYLLSLVPQVALVAGAYMDFAWLSVIVFFLVLPVVRLIVGNDRSPPNVRPTGLLLLYLQTVPRLYVLGWFCVLPWSIWFLSHHAMNVPGGIGFAMGLWIVTSLDTAVAHELIHCGNSFDRKLGGFMDATVGYFHFAEEHLSHHAKSGFAVDGDAARPGQSVYTYVWRRYWRSHRHAWTYETARLKRQSKGWVYNRLLRKSLIPIAVAGCYFHFAGWLGLSIYGFQIVGTAITVQVITYLQHWALTERDTPELADFGFSWDDGCWIQACVTLNHAFHAHHHLKINLPYYQIGPLRGGLTLPASYPVMFVTALFPKFFTRIMAGRLAAWLESAELREKLNHEADCVGASRIVRAINQKPATDLFRSRLKGLQ